MVYVIQGYYSDQYGWEDLCAYEDRLEARTDLKAYDLEEPQYEHRLVEQEASYGD